GHGTVGEIDARAPQARFTVERRAGPDVVGHVGDVNVKQVIAPGQSLHVHGVVKVLGRLAVNGDDGQRAKVAPDFAVALGDVLWRGVRLRQHLGWETMRQVELADHDLYVHAELVTAA